MKAKLAENASQQGAQHERDPRQVPERQGLQNEGRPRLAIVLKGYPRLSETFIAQEILEIQRAGFEFEIVSLRHPYDPSTHPVHAEIKAPVRYLPEYLHNEPMRVFKSWRKARKLPGYGEARSKFMADLKRDFTRNRIRRFGQALVMAAEIPADTDLIYVHFLHTPTSASRYAAIMREMPFSISAHAKDIWTSPDWEIREKLIDCSWLVTCTKGGYEHLRTLADKPEKVHLVYHGIDLSRFGSPDEQKTSPGRDGSDPQNPLQLITVGRAVAKKGIDTLIDALATLPGDFHWHWTHIGGGELKDKLREQAKAVGIDPKCEFLGALPQSEVIAAYRTSDMFIMPCRIAKSGDRDGLPNVFVEAQSQALPVISTPISGIPELIENGNNGVLVEPDNVGQLAKAILDLGKDPAKRKKMGVNGQAIVRSQFDHLSTIGELIGYLNETASPQQKGEHHG